IAYDQFCGLAPAAAAASPSGFPSGWETTVEELKRRVDAKEDVFILDVREPNEYQICRIPGSTLIPLGELTSRVADVRAAAGDPHIVVHCKMGGRSAKAVRLLRERGVENAQNLTGGILAWIDRIDPTQPKY